MAPFQQMLFRRKQQKGDGLQTELNRCLSTLDMILIGIGSMVGSGMYVLTGQIAHSITGPGLTISFLLAGLAHSLSVMFYAEFGSRVPKTGGPYIYTYLLMGEFPAFIVAWPIILENLTGAAVTTKSLVAYMNDLLETSLDFTFPEVEQNFHIDPYSPVYILIICVVVSCGKQHPNIILTWKYRVVLLSFP